MARKLTTEEWVINAKIIHGSRFDYSNVVYINNTTDITIVCPTHGEFQQTPKHHINGKGCRHCSIAERGVLSRKPFEKFVQEANIVHKNKYVYLKDLYNKATDNIRIICPIHGEFSQQASVHLSGSGCNDCGYETTSNKLRQDIKIWRDKVSELHDNKYEYSHVNYKNMNTNVTIICPIHGTFPQTPASHLNGRGCPSCSKNGFDVKLPAYLYYLKVTTNEGKELYKIGITNRTVETRFSLADLQKIEIVKQKLYGEGQEALDWETKLKRKYKEYRYQGPNILSSGNTELFTEDIIAMWYG